MLKFQQTSHTRWKVQPKFPNTNTPTVSSNNNHVCMFMRHCDMVTVMHRAHTTKLNQSLREQLTVANLAKIVPNTHSQQCKEKSVWSGSADSYVLSYCFRGRSDGSCWDFFTWIFTKSSFLLLVSPMPPTASLNNRVVVCLQ